MSIRACKRDCGLSAIAPGDGQERRGDRAVAFGSERLKVTQSAKPMDYPTTNPAFIVGVTGYMDLDQAKVTVVRRQLEWLFYFLRFGARYPGREEPIQSFADELKQWFPDPTAIYPFVSTFEGWEGL